MLKRVHTTSVGNFFSIFLFLWQQKWKSNKVKLDFAAGKQEVRCMKNFLFTCLRLCVCVCVCVCYFMLYLLRVQMYAVRFLFGFSACLKQETETCPNISVFCTGIILVSLFLSFAEVKFVTVFVGFQQRKTRK